MHPLGVLATFVLSAVLSTFADAPKLRGIGAAMEEMITKKEVAGAVTVLVTKG